MAGETLSDIGKAWASMQFRCLELSLQRVVSRRRPGHANRVSLVWRSERRFRAASLRVTLSGNLAEIWAERFPRSAAKF